MADDKLAVVLGGAGFIGSHLTEALLSRGQRVRVFDRTNVNLQNLEGLTGDWDFVGGDFQSETDQARALSGVDTVYHLISTTIPATSNQDPVFDVESNLLPSVRLLETAREKGVRQVVFTSSGGTVYGTPTQPEVTESHDTNPLVSYGVVKLAVEKYLALYQHHFGLDYQVVRLANPYGPRQDTRGAQGAASVFLGRAHSGKPIEIWGDGTVVRDYIYVSDAVDGILAAGDHSASGKVFNIGSGSGVSLNELLDSIRSVSGRELNVSYLPGRSFDVPVNVLDITKARQELGWEPKTPLVEGLQETWTWLGRTPPQ